LFLSFLRGSFLWSRYEPADRTFIRRASPLVCLFLLLIKDHIRVIAEVLYTLAFLVWWHYAMHGDRESLRFSLFFILGLVLTISVGAVFRAFVLKGPINPMY